MTDDRKWTPVAEKLPINGVAVETGILIDGIVAPMLRKVCRAGVWFYLKSYDREGIERIVPPEFIPTHWRMPA